jgi:hypothetical protein
MPEDTIIDTPAEGSVEGVSKEVVDSITAALEGKPAVDMSTAAADAAAREKAIVSMARIRQGKGAHQQAPSADQQRQRVQARHEEELEEGAIDPELTPPAKAEETADDAVDELTDEDEESGSTPTGYAVPPLDPGIRNRLLQNGMSAASIDAAYEADPAGALQFWFKALNGQATQAQAAAPPAADPLLKLKIDPLDYERRHGKQDADVLRTVLSRLDASEQALAEQRQAVVIAERDAVTDELGKQFPQLYGQLDRANPEQIAFRDVLFTKANEIIQGRKAQGLQTTVRQAIAEAHKIVAFDHVATSTQRTTVNKLKTRARQFTLKPGNRSVADKPRNAKEQLDYAAKIAQDKMDELGM